MCHLMNVAHYFATFLVALLGLVLALLLRGARLWGRVSRTSRLLQTSSSVYFSSSERTHASRPPGVPTVDLS